MRGVLSQIRAELNRLKAEPIAGAAGDGAEARAFRLVRRGLPVRVGSR